MRRPSSAVMASAVGVAQLRSAAPVRQQVAMRVSRMVAMWQIAESWWRSVCMSRLYFAAELGVDLAGLVGGHEQGFAQQRVTGLGEPVVVFAWSRTG